MEPNRFGDIAAFVSAVKAGSFTAAAASLGLTRSAVGKSIARLEARMAVRLLNRTTRKLSLTDEGLVAFERWRQILDDLDEVESTMAQRRGKPTGTLRLTAPLSLGQRHVLPILDAYLKQWPDLRADIRFTDRFVDLVEEGVDVAVRIGAPKEDSQLLTRTSPGSSSSPAPRPNTSVSMACRRHQRTFTGMTRSPSWLARSRCPGASIPPKGCTCARSPGG
jgi:DNA-binding transcriptional LysR family regulator